ncbi:MAG: TonB-dependent receptor [Burkholderiales bacterium]|nr:TonB-dependent receptor [Bacteroidia bacterium]
MKTAFTYLFIFLSILLASQNDTIKTDSIKIKKKVELVEVVVTAEKDNTFGISRLNNVEGTTIYAGKKTEAIYLNDLNANLASNNSRQIFAKVAGINIFENDGAGSSIGIGGRGLNPNRISNFNTRQNGYDISADALGYPESYYVPPAEAIERIEILRGAASLQFGTQFGGMINYKFNDPSSRKIALHSRQTLGSFGFFNSFNQLSGTVKKITYSTFYDYKHYKGWRPNAELNSHTAYVQLGYHINDRIFIKAEYTHLNYLNQQPGGLTDKQFLKDATQSNRTRNWFKVNWNLYNLNADFKLNDRTRLNVLVFGVYAGRDALGTLERTDRQEDTTKNRNLLSDVYNNFATEIRLLRRYTFLKNQSNFLIGVRAYKGITTRKQGEADKTNKPNFVFLNPNNLENSSYQFPSTNLAAFSENIFQLTSKWSITPGIRWEYINTNSNGYYRLLNKDLAGNILLDKKIEDIRSSTRSFILLGIGSQYKITKGIELYANFSQNYRSINFNDMRVVNPNFQVDPNLRDESGFTTDGGIRGVIKNLLYFDVSGFLLKYNNRIGTVLKVDSSTYQIVRYRTNVSDSRNIGIEAFAELDWLKLFRKNTKHKLSTFINTSFIDAIYVSSQQNGYNNKKVEYVPEFIIRTGITYGYKKFGITCQYAYTSQQFSDATNAITTPSAIYGLIPSYSVADVSANYTYKFIGINAGINNVLNAAYFTRRAEGYPGPGIIPSDPFNIYTTLIIKL